MVQKRKKISASQVKSTSKRLRTATLGTHVSRRSYSADAERVNFSNNRKRRQADRGFVESVLPSSERRDRSHANSRVGNREFTQEVRKRSTFSRIKTIVKSLIALFVIVCAVTVTVYLSQLNSRITFTDSDVSAVLVDPGDESAFYVLVAVDFDTTTSSDTQDGSEAYALVRLDTDEIKATIISLPSNTMTTLSDGETAQLCEVEALEGDAALIEAVATLAGVDVTHFVSIDAKGIAQIVDYFGSVEVEVYEEVDDPTAGDIFIFSGTQTLDSAAVLTLLKATNYFEGVESQSANLRALLESVSLLLLTDSMGDFFSLLDHIGGSFSSDLNLFEALSLTKSLYGITSDDIQGALASGSETTVDGVVYYSLSSTQWAAMMELVDAGENPATEPVVIEVEASDYTVTVRNGGAADGSATSFAGTLSDLGFEIEEIGNTDSSAYTESLVIYKNSVNADAAEAILLELGVGHTVYDVGYYVFETDILVIVTSDWVSVS